MGNSRWHTVEQGESLDNIARNYGRTPERIWGAAENAQLRKERGDGNILSPGDRLFIPPLDPPVFSVATGADASFVVDVPKPILRLRLLRHSEPRAHCPYALTVDGIIVSSGETDANGELEEVLPNDASQAALRLEGDAGPTYVLNLRTLDPITQVTGIQARLRHLGLYAGAIDGVLGRNTRAALCAFQNAHGLRATGEPDGATTSALKTWHGC